MARHPTAPALAGRGTLMCKAAALSKSPACLSVTDCHLACRRSHKDGSEQRECDPTPRSLHACCSCAQAGDLHGRLQEDGPRAAPAAQPRPWRHVVRPVGLRRAPGNVRSDPRSAPRRPGHCRLPAGHCRARLLQARGRGTRGAQREGREQQDGVARGIHCPWCNNWSQSGAVPCCSGHCCLPAHCCCAVPSSAAASKWRSNVCHAGQEAAGWYGKGYSPGTRQRSEWLGPSAALPWQLLPPSLPINAVLGCSMDLYLISSIPCGISCLLSVPVRASLQDVCLIPELRNNVCLHLSEEFSPNLIPRICASCVPLSCIHRVSPIMPGSVPHPRLLRLLVRPQQQERHHCQQQQREHGHRQR